VNEDQQKRLAQNEAVFRDVNENIKDVVSDLPGRDGTYEFVCECADSGCTMRITLTLAKYARIRSSPVRFVIAPGHEVAAVESVVEEHDGHAVVEKHGVAGAIAAAYEAGS
jgi:hypothetical protein